MQKYIIDRWDKDSTAKIHTYNTSIRSICNAEKHS